MRDLTHSELHTDTLQLLNLSHSLRAIMNKVQNNSGPKFGLEDLTDPSKLPIISSVAYFS